MRRAILVALCLAAVLVLLLGTPAHGQQSLQFAEAGDYALIPHDSLLVLPETTVEVWFRVHALGDTSQGGGEQSILDVRGPDGGYQFRLAGPDFPLGAGIVSGSGFIFNTDLVSFYRWHHMALSQDADSMSVYVDGTLVDRMANEFLSGSPADLFLGELTGCTTGCLWLRGEVDELRIWDRARTQEEIADSMYVKLAGDEPGLVGYWDFDDDTGTTITDRTGNAEDGTLHGNAVLVPSDAPVGFEPLPAPTGFRTHGGENEVTLLWKPLDSSDLGGYAIYRADSLLVPLDPDHLLATVPAPASTYVDASALLDHTAFYAIAGVNTGGHQGLAYQETAGRRTHIPKDYLVGTHFFPSRGGGDWWTGFYFRGVLAPPQPPALGLYNSGDPAVIDQQLDWMADYGIDFFASEWLGQAALEDSVLRVHIVPAMIGRPTRFTVFYHSDILPDPGNIDPAQEDQLSSDFNYIADTYFNHPNFLRVGNRPVVFIYRSLRFGGDYEQAFARIRQELLQKGYDVYLVGDEINRAIVPNVDHFQFLDAVTMWRGLGRPPADGAYVVDGNALGGNARYIALWHQAALAYGKGFLPPVSPGSNTRHLNPDARIVPREIEAGAGPTSQLEEHIRLLRSYVDPQLKAVMIMTWNHWESDTQVEPSVVSLPTTEDASGTGLYTGGYSYTGYGTRCLETIQSLLGYDPGRVILVSPPDAADGQARRTRFAWSELEGASTYHLQVSTTPDFTNLVVDRRGVAAAVSDADTLAANVVYHWRVRGESSGGSGAWSDPFAFTTGTLVPVTLAYLRAEREAGGAVRLAWEVLDPGAAAGFHVYRDGAPEPGGGAEPERVRLTPHLLTGGPEFAFTDVDAPGEIATYRVLEIDRSGGETWHGPVRAAAAPLPVWPLSLDRNRPNPVVSTTTLAFTLPAAGEVRLEILDATGRLAAVPFAGACPPGRREIVWDGRDERGRRLPGGIYFVRLVTEAGTRTAKLMLLR